MDDFQREVPVLFRKYEVKKKIGQGAFGAVYLGKSISDGRSVAIKVEKKTIARPSLESEAFILANLKGEGIPEILSYGKRKNYTVLVEPLLGQNLFNVFINNNMCFPLEDICLMSIQFIERIHFVHSNFIIHRDIKPDNFLIGRDDPNIIYLVDFGLSKKYRSSKTKKHVQFSITGKLTGTIRFSSPNAIRGGEQSRKDDLVSIGYMIIFLMKKKLPWQNIKAKNDVERYIKIYRMKKQLKAEMLCQNLPEEMTRYMRYVLHLGFEENPNYKLLADLFKSILKKNKLDYEKLLFSWIKPSDIAKIKKKADLHKRKSSSRERLLKKISQNLDIKQRELSSDPDNNSYDTASKTKIGPSNIKVVRNDSKDNFDISVQLTQNNSKIGNTNTLVLNFEKTINNQLIAEFDEVDKQMESKDTLNNNKETLTFEKEKLSDINMNIINHLKQNKNDNSEVNKIQNNLKPDSAMNQKNKKNNEFYDISMGDNIFNTEKNMKYKGNINFENVSKFPERNNFENKNQNNEINSFKNIDFKKQNKNEIYTLLQNNEHNNGNHIDKIQENKNIKNINLNQNLNREDFYNDDSNQRKMIDYKKNNINEKEVKNPNKKTLIDDRVKNIVNALKNDKKTNQNLENDNNINKNHMNNKKMIHKQKGNNQIKNNEEQNIINKGNMPQKNMNNKNIKNFKNNFNPNELNLDDINNIKQKLFNKKNKNINPQFNPNNTENNQKPNDFMQNELNNNIMNNNFNNNNFIINTEPTNINAQRMKMHKNITYQKDLIGRQNNFDNDFNNLNHDFNNNNNFEMNINNNMRKREDNLFPDNSGDNYYPSREDKMMNNRQKGKNHQMMGNYMENLNNMGKIQDYDYDNQMNNINNMRNKNINKMKNMKNMGKMKNINNLRNNNNMNNINNMTYQNKMNNMYNINNINNMKYMNKNNGSKKNQKPNNQNFNAYKNQDLFQQSQFNNMNNFPDNNNYNFNNYNNKNYNPLFNNIQNQDTNFGQYSNFPDDNI